MNALVTLIADRYDVNALSCDAIVIGWAADILAESAGHAAAAKAWRALNRKRERLGRYTTIPQYGTPMFAAFCAK